MTEQGQVHLDSRRLKGEGEIGFSSEGKWGDYCIELEDSEAIAKSPFRNALEALKEFGFDTVLIFHPYKKDSEESIEEWVVIGEKQWTGTEQIVGDGLGGKITLNAKITENGERELKIRFGGGEDNDFDSEDLNEMVWGYLEVIHKSLSNSWVGRGVPIVSRGQEQG